MPPWGILKSSKTKSRSARKVHFSTDGEEGKVGSTDSSISLESDTSSEEAGYRGGHTHIPLPHLHQHQDLPSPGHLLHADISHGDIQDEEERSCLRHLDQLGLALENTYKEVESIDAYVNKLRYEFDHEMVAEKRYMSCMCSAKIARVACCKKQIGVWHQLQHDIQETCCHHHPHSPDPLNHHHHPHSPDPLNHHHHHCGNEMSLTDAECSLLDTSSDSFSMSTTGSLQEEGEDCSHSGDVDMELVLYHVSKMVLFDVVHQRLDPSVDGRTFIQHWIFNDNDSS